MIRKELKCPNCNWKGTIYCYTQEENIYCPDCCELIYGNDECYCKECDWNNNNHCMIPRDDHVTFGEDCPYIDE